MGNQLSVSRVTWVHVQQSLLLTIFLIVSTAVGQPQVTNTPFRANARHTLSCEREQQWECSWQVQRGGTGPFQTLEVGTELVRASTLPGDVDILLNEETKGTYECHCRLNGGHEAVVRKRVFFYSADQRFGCFRDKVALERGSQTRVSVCYLSFLPESRNVGTVVLVDEASGNRTLKLVRNFSATFTVKEPGSYHFEASTAHGIINSTSFNVTLEDERPGPDNNGTMTTPPTDGTGLNLIIGTTIAACIIVAVLIVLGALAIGSVTWKKRTGRFAPNNGGQDEEMVVAQEQGDGQPQEAVEADIPLGVDEQMVDSAEVAPNANPSPEEAEANLIIANQPLEDEPEEVDNPPPSPDEVGGNEQAAEPFDEEEEKAADNVPLHTGVVTNGSALPYVEGLPAQCTSHHEQPPRGDSPASNHTDTESVCVEATEETCLQQNPPSIVQPVQEVGNRRDEEIAFRGASCTGGALERIGNDTEVESGDQPNPPPENIIVKCESSNVADPLGTTMSNSQSGVSYGTNDE